MRLQRAGQQATDEEILAAIRTKSGHPEAANGDLFDPKAGPFGPDTAKH
jgi:hypothetical protein